MPPRSLSIPASVERLAEVRSFVRQAGAAFGASSRATEDLVQAVDEAACNVIVHGYRGRAGDLRIQAEPRRDAIVIRLLDDAPPFDPTKAPASNLDRPPLRRRPGGMGVHLLTTMVDEVHHQARPGGGNELLLVRRLGDDGGREPGSSRDPGRELPTREEG